MNCERSHSLLLEFHDGLLSPAECQAVQVHLDACPVCRRELAQLHETLGALDQLPAEEPSPALRANFNQMLATELAAERAKKFRPSRLEALRTLLGHLLPSGPFSQLAFSAAMLTVGLFVGAKVLAPVATPAAEDPATRKELAQLREKVDSMTQLVAYSVARQETDNARLVQATFALQNGKNDSAHLVNLVSMLAFDPSTNVRLSALESLYAHADNKLVRDGVLSSLPRENSPLVQLAMIDFLASLRERQAAPAFETLSLDAKTDKEVRQAARRALAQL